MTICKRDSLWEFSIWCRELKPLPCDNLEGWEVGERFNREGIYVYLWLIHVDIWPKPIQYCKAIILQLKMCMYVLVTSHVWLFATPWTVAYQASLSMGFSRQEHWNGLPFLSPGDLPNPGIKHESLYIRHLFFSNFLNFVYQALCSSISLELT